MLTLRLGVKGGCSDVDLGVVTCCSTASCIASGPVDIHLHSHEAEINCTHFLPEADYRD